MDSTLPGFTAGLGPQVPTLIGPAYAQGAYSTLPVFGECRTMVLPLPGRDFVVEGGPFSLAPKQPGVARVCLDDKAKGPREIECLSKDFGTPSPAVLDAALRGALRALYRGDKLFVGCGAGIGRTGFFLAALVKIGAPEWIDPIPYVRENYKFNAVETVGQGYMLGGLDVRPFRRLARWLSFCAQVREVIGR